MRLAELKICGALKRCYTCDVHLARRKKGVERRSSVLPEEYRKQLSKLDQNYHHTAIGLVGPLERDYRGMESSSVL